MFRFVLLCLGVATASAITFSQEHIDGLLELGAPKLAKFIQRANSDPKSVYDDIRNSPLSTILPVLPLPLNAPPAPPSAPAPPLVVAHGMGDSCFNKGMKQITAEGGKRVNAYSVCIPTGNNDIEDTINGFLLNLDKSIDVFAAKVRNDTMLKDGFNAFSLSQGGLLIRGYIQKYNDPPVLNFLAGWPIVMGVAGFPHCPPGGALLGPVCSMITEALGSIAYDKLIQDILFQANMFRDPTKVNNTQYKANSMLADLNNVGITKNASYATNFNIVKKWIMIRGLKDTMVWPNQGEWWELPNEDPALWNKDQAIEPMNSTSLYKSNAFGLATADKAGKIVYESSPGDHMQFTMEQFYAWCDKYLCATCN